VLGVNVGLAGPGGVAATGIFFTSGRCAAELAANGALAAIGALFGIGALAAPGALFGPGALAALGELLAKGVGRGAPTVELGALGSNSVGGAAETSLSASTGGGGSLPGSASPIPGTLETWIT